MVLLMQRWGSNEATVKNDILPQPSRPHLPKQQSKQSTFSSSTIRLALFGISLAWAQTYCCSCDYPKDMAKIYQ